MDGSDTPFVDSKEHEMKQRLLEARQREEDEREAHQLATMMAAEKQTEELNALMADLKEPEKRAIRLEAVKMALHRGVDSQYANGFQMHVDALATQMARYAVTGQV